jgi:hypothetical protein
MAGNQGLTSQERILLTGHVRHAELHQSQLQVTRIQRYQCAAQESDIALTLDED